MLPIVQQEKGIIIMWKFDSYNQNDDAGAETTCG